MPYCHKLNNFNQIDVLNYVNLVLFPIIFIGLSLNSNAKSMWLLMDVL